MGSVRGLLGGVSVCPIICAQWQRSHDTLQLAPAPVKVWVFIVALAIGSMNLTMLARLVPLRGARRPRIEDHYGERAPAVERSGRAGIRDAAGILLSLAGIVVGAFTLALLR